MPECCTVPGIITGIVPWTGNDNHADCADAEGADGFAGVDHSSI